MESKGRRAPRAAAPSITPVDVVPSAGDSPEPATPTEGLAEGLASAESLAEVVTPLASSPSSPGAGAPAAAAKTASSDDLADFGREALAALAQSQAAVARGLEALSAEMAGLALSGIDAAARTATDMLAVKTLSDAIEVNAGFTRSSFDALLGGSAKLSEIGAKLAAEASQPILAQLSRSWVRAARRAI
jgi:hypothetical protein